MILHLGDFSDIEVKEESFGKRFNEALKALTPEVESTADKDRPDPNQNINPPRSPRCDNTGDDSFLEAEANTEIDDFCDTIEDWKHIIIVPPISTGTGATRNGRNKALGIYNEGPSINGTDKKIWLGITFAQDHCIGSFSVAGGNKEKDIINCKSYFKTILSGCGGSGGILQNSCDVWYLKLSTGNPADTYWQNRGNIECSDVCSDDKCREVLGNSPLSNACSCWYSNYNTVTTTFNRPESGICDPNEIDRSYEFSG